MQQKMPGVCVCVCVCVCFQPLTNNDFDFSNNDAKAVGTEPSSDYHQYETGWGRGHPPNFFVSLVAKIIK